MTTIYIQANKRDELEKLIRDLPAILAGRVADRGGIARGFKLRMAFMFFSLIKDAFITKARGGTDEAGISWPPLSKKYLAYSRGPKSTRTAGGMSPGGKDGFMSPAQLKQWQKDYGQARAWLAASIGDGREAKSRAAAIAWNKAKARGVRTKLNVFGNRTVEILRDRGILFNSLSPGIMSGGGGLNAGYSPSDGQVVDSSAGFLLVGTNVEYAIYHQSKPGKRPLWPKDGNLPDAWMEDIVDSGISGLTRISDILAN